MSTKTVAIDDDVVHTVEDANPTSSQCVENLVIQCDKHGLTIEFPMGENITIDFSVGKFNIYKFNDCNEQNPMLLTSIAARHQAVD